MKEKAKNFIKPVKEFWLKLNFKIRVGICAGLGLIVVLAVVLSVTMNQTQYKVLYSGLKQTDFTTILSSLDEQSVPYKIENASTVLVPEDRVADLKMDFATQGLPKTQPNYDYFTQNIGNWTTDFEKNKIALYQTQTFLEQTIETMNAVKSATVAIAAPDNSGYVIANKSVPTASVTLDLAEDLTPEQVSGIKKVVANGVPDLTVENIVVVDTNSMELASSDNGTTQVSASNFKLDIERQFQTDMESSILKLLGPMYGNGNVRVAVRADVNVDKSIKEITTYIPSEDGDNTGVLEEHTSDKQAGIDGSGTGGIPGTETNAEIPGYANVTVNGNIITTKDAETYKYLVSQVKEQIEKNSAELQKVTVSIVINERTMDETTRESLRGLVTGATGALTENISIVNSQWANGGTPTTPEDPGAQKSIWEDPIILWGVVGLAGLLFLLILTFSIIASAKRKKRKKIAALEAAAAEAAARQLAESQNNNEEEVLSLEAQAQDNRSKALQKEIQNFASHNPEIAAQLIRTWLKGGDGSA